MPTYEYLCQTCRHRFEQWQKMTDEPLTTCPECGGHIRRVFYPTGVVFKGSGFYKTDHSTSTDHSTAGTDKKDESTNTSPKTESTSNTSSGENKTSTPTEVGTK